MILGGTAPLVPLRGYAPIINTVMHNYTESCIQKSSLTVIYLYTLCYVHTVYRQGTYIYVHNQEIEYFQETVLLMIQKRKSIFVELL